MTREQIEKAAFQCAKDRWEYSGVQNAKVKVRGTVFGFKMGAQWRINSVWHDMVKEEPQVYGEYENKIAPSIPCLVLGYLSTGYGYGVRYWNVDCEVWDDEQADDFECKKDKIEKWAYLDDLLPERKEETK